MIKKRNANKSIIGRLQGDYISKLKVLGVGITTLCVIIIALLLQAFLVDIEISVFKPISYVQALAVTCGLHVVANIFNGERDGK